MSEERTIIRGPNGEVWQEPPPNSPVQAKPGWMTRQQMTAKLSVVTGAPPHDVRARTGRNGKKLPLRLLQHRL